jgi:DNA-binding XRE family transcriptional regulator
MVREVGDAEVDLARLDAALRAGGRPRPSAEGFDPSALELAGVSLRPGGRVLRVRFARGAKVDFDLGVLGLAARATAARVDDLRHGVVLRLANDDEVDVSSGRILFESDARYRETHRGATADLPDVGARVRALRLAAGRTARDVAAAAGLAPSNYARLEARRHAPRIETLLRVARALGVPLADLLREEPRVRAARRR